MVPEVVAPKTTDAHPLEVAEEVGALPVAGVAAVDEEALVRSGEVPYLLPAEAQASFIFRSGTSRNSSRDHRASLSSSS